MSPLHSAVNTCNVDMADFFVRQCGLNPNSKSYYVLKDGKHVNYPCSQTFPNTQGGDIKFRIEFMEFRTLFPGYVMRTTPSYDEDKLKMVRTLLRAGVDIRKPAKSYTITKMAGQSRAIVRTEIFPINFFGDGIKKYGPQYKCITLANLCRKVINKALCSADSVNELPIPDELKEYIALERDCQCGCIDNESSNKDIMKN